MDRKEKLRMLRKLSEADLSKKFLIPLFESDGMGCSFVGCALHDDRFAQLECDVWHHLALILHPRAAQEPGEPLSH